MRRTSEVILSIAVVCILAFLVSYAAFFYIKERNCAKSIYYSGCYLTYTQFVRGLVGLK